MMEQGTKEPHLRLRTRGMTPEEIMAAARHRERCAECAAAAEEEVDAGAAGELWAETLRSSLGDHLRGEELFDYADGRLPEAAAAGAGAHLEHCAICRDDVADLRSLRRPPMMKWQKIALAAAAVSILVVVIATPLLRRASKPAKTASMARSAPSSPVLSSTGEPNARRALVDAALNSGRIDPPPILATLHQPGDTARGEAGSASATVSPDGIVVEDPRPRFEWSGPPRATYTVSVFTGEQEVARSAPLRQNNWTPDRELERGRTYRWQVEARRGGETSIIPPAPQPVPAFFLLGSDGHREMESARRRGDHLLLGVLAAHYGLRQEAIEQLTLYRAVHPESSAASSLLDSVRAGDAGGRQ